MTPLTITHPESEDSSGVAGSTVYEVNGLIIAVTEAQRAAMFGDVPAGTVNIFVDPEGFGGAWKLRAGDMVTDGVLTAKVREVTPVSNPRTGELKVVEATGGLS